MRSNFISIFVNSAGMILLAAASVLFFSNWANAWLVSPQDPLFLISMRVMFWILGGMALGIALACLFQKPGAMQMILILWFAMSLIAYRLCLSGVHAFGGFIGFFNHAADTFGVSVNSANIVLYMMIGYLLLGSGLSLAAMKISVTTSRPAGRPANKLLKTACFFCKKEIEFPPHVLGGKMACPYCKMDITLKEPA
ncbi:MAG TPA: hypothetical protein VG347_23115 [Verrucomicrobiae bacterium]|nr:hypothetical protein [Verrucomicrobiae bacterium]